jgi:hypothetical protein
MAPTLDVGVVPAATAMSGVAAALESGGCEAEFVTVEVGCPEVAAVEGRPTATGWPAGGRVVRDIGVEPPPVVVEGDDGAADTGSDVDGDGDGDGDGVGHNEYVERALPESVRSGTSHAWSATAVAARFA